MATLEQARKAKNKLAKQLMGSFNGAASPVNSVGISGTPANYHVVVGLEREPTADERKKMPAVCDGVEVRYNKPSGQIRAY